MTTQPLTCPSTPFQMARGLRLLDKHARSEHDFYVQFTEYFIIQDELRVALKQPR